MKRKIKTVSMILALSVSNLIYSQEKEVDFNQSYIKKNDQKTTIEINEAQELIYIILSITDFGKENPNMTKQSTEYFKEVKAYFTPFSNHEVVKKFDGLLRENLPMLTVERMQLLSICGITVQKA